jgi:pyruvate dehydrogenase complex dehydrogenase (E1) component
MFSKGIYRVRTAGSGNASSFWLAVGFRRGPARTKIQAVQTCSIAAYVPSAASYSELRREALAGKSCNRLLPDRSVRTPHR